MNNNLRQALENINFLKRYHSLADKYKKTEGLLADYHVDEATKTLQRVSQRPVEYIKSETFFKIKSRENGIDFTMHISLKHGGVDLISYTERDGMFFEGCSSWSNMANSLGHEGNIHLPTFTSYTELEQILTEAFAIYEDFKKELTRLESSE